MPDLFKTILYDINLYNSFAPELLYSHKALFYGLLCLAMAYLTHLMGDSVLLVSLHPVVTK